MSEYSTYPHPERIADGPLYDLGLTAAMVTSAHLQLGLSIMQIVDMCTDNCNLLRNAYHNLQDICAASFYPLEKSLPNAAPRWSHNSLL